MKLRGRGRADGRRRMRVVPDSTAAVDSAAVAEARKGTAAADPVIGVTPEGQVLPGAVVNGEFVETGALRPEPLRPQSLPESYPNSADRSGSGDRSGRAMR